MSRNTTCCRRYTSYLAAGSTELAPDPLAPYVNAATLEEAEQALLAIEHPSRVDGLGDVYDDLAGLAADAEDFASAERFLSSLAELLDR